MSDPDMGYWTYDYDALGNLTIQTDARGCKLLMEYDSLNRMTRKYSTLAQCIQQVDTSYTYDAGTNGKGHRTSMSDGSGSTTWTYDPRGRVTGEQRMFIGAAFNTGWTYNSADLPETMTYPDGEEVTYEYNNRMLLEILTGSANYVTGTEYDAAGRIDLRTFGNGTQADYQYFPWNQQGGGASSPSSVKNPPPSVPQRPLCAAPCGLGDPRNPRAVFYARIMVSSILKRTGAYTACGWSAGMMMASPARRI